MLFRRYLLIVYLMYINVCMQKAMAPHPSTLAWKIPWMEIQPVHSKGDQPWVFFGRNDAKAETPVLWPPHAKS